MASPRISRRRFLAAAAGAGAAALVPAGLAQARTIPRPDPGARRRVAVAGAGLAGLTAALDLTAAGWDVVVLEARDRVGGRVHTLRDPFSPGMHAEAGGESIDDGHTEIQALISRFGLRTERRPALKPYDAAVYYEASREPLGAFVARRGGAVLQDVLRFYDAMAALAEGIDPEHPERAANAHALDARSLEGLLREARLVPEAEFLMRLQQRAVYNAELADISLLFVAQQEAAGPGGPLAELDLFTAETMRVTGGNDRLVEAMAASLGPRVRLRSPVTRVDHHARGVRVHGRGRPLDAAWLVVATPMMPLRRVAFSPPLPHTIRAAVAGLDLGHAVKVMREYAAPFWTAEGFSGFTVTDLPFAVGWAATDSQATPGGILTEFVTGRAGRDAAARREPNRVDTFLAQLDEVYPEGVPLATERTASMAWANEPYTGGGYAVYRPGQMAPFYAALRDGAGRIRFAGEHLSPMAGYMESAVRSGRAAAARIGPPPE
jgi:monoamine oxidase